TGVPEAQTEEDGAYVGNVTLLFTGDGKPLTNSDGEADLVGTLSNLIVSLENGNVAVFHALAKTKINFSVYTITYIEPPRSLLGAASGCFGAYANTLGNNTTYAEFSYLRIGLFFYAIIGREQSTKCLPHIDVHIEPGSPGKHKG